jgi:HAD superfamily hydrolase (TIGR01450 family)
MWLEFAKSWGGAGNVVLCIGGHTHRNHASTIDGIHYLTVQSLSDSYTTQGEAAGAWAMIELGEDVYWRTHGRDPIEFRRPIRARNEHWLTPLPGFAEHLAQTIRQAGLDDIKGAILDVDGVLVRGGEAVPGAVEAVAQLRAHGLKLVLLTNNARARAPQLADRLSGLGFDFQAVEIVTSGQALAAFLEPGSTVHIVGSAALKAEVLAAGAVESDTPDFVVAGANLDLGVAELTVALRHVLNGARLLTSNTDRLIPGSAGMEPEAGPIVAFLERASGCKARSFGKPAAAIFELALERLALEAAGVIVVGDNSETDIAGATAARMRSVKVDSDLNHGEEKVYPSFEFNDLKDFTDNLLRLSS